MKRLDIDRLARLADALRMRVIAKGGDDTDTQLVELIPLAVETLRADRADLMTKAVEAASEVARRPEQGRCAACLKAIVEAIQ